MILKRIEAFLFSKEYIPSQMIKKNLIQINNMTEIKEENEEKENNNDDNIESEVLDASNKKVDENLNIEREKEKEKEKEKEIMIDIDDINFGIIKKEEEFMIIDENENEEEDNNKKK